MAGRVPSRPTTSRREIVKFVTVAAMLILALAGGGAFARSAQQPKPAPSNQAAVYRLSNIGTGCARIYADRGQVDVPAGQSRDVTVFGGRNYLVSVFKRANVCGGSAARSQWVNANGSGHWEIL
jgi:hypothetical protein